MRYVRFGAALLAAMTTTGCLGTIRDTNSPRSAQEMLLISTAAQRAVRQYDAKPLGGKKVFLDLALFDPMDKNYVQSSLRYHLAAAGVTIADKADDCEIVMEVRNASLGIWNGDFTLGIPPLPLSAPTQSSSLVTPPLYLFRRLSHQGFAKFQFWLYDPKTKKYLGRSGDLWGNAYYNQWWWFAIGPFDGSNDVFPDTDFSEMAEMTGDTGDQPAEFMGDTASPPADTSSPPKGE